MAEKWITIDGFENYQVSNYGRIKRLEHYSDGYYYGNLIKKYYPEKIIDKFAKSGKYRNYYYLKLTNNNGKQKTFAVHRLVAEYFVPNPDNKPCVDHIDNNPLNNRADNLRWCTYSENKKWGYEKRREDNTLNDYYKKGTKRGPKRGSKGDKTKEKSSMKRGRKPGYTHSEETKAKMKGKKKPYTEEHRAKMAEAKRGNKLITIDGKRHRVKVNSFEELRQIAFEKNWWVSEEELRIEWSKIKPQES